MKPQGCSIGFVGLDRGVRLRVISPFLLLMLASGCDPHGRPVSEQDEQDGLDVLVGDWVEMWNSYDLDQVGNLFLNDPRLSYFSSEKEGVIQGFESVLDHHRGFGFVPGGESRPSRLWLEGLRTDVLGEAAVITGIWFFQTDPETGEDPQRGPVTFVATRDGGVWRFVHMNFSAYLPPETL